MRRGPATTRVASALLLVLTAALVAVAAPAAAAPRSARAGARARAVTGRYLLSFLACDRAALGAGCDDPRNHEVYLAESDDGLSWSLVPGWTPYAGSVPDVIRRGGTIYLYTPNEVARYDLATGTLRAPVPVTVSGLGPAGFVDPSLIQESDGRLVLFFLPGLFGGDPAGCAPGQSACTKELRSATEVAGSDGTRFTLDAGARATVALSGPGHPTASDPDVFFDGSRYLLLVSEGLSEVAFASTALHGAYAQALTVDEGTGGVASGAYDAASGDYWIYAQSAQGTPGGVSVIRRATMPAASPHELGPGDWATVLTGAQLGLAGYDVGSPGFAANVPGLPAPAAKPATTRSAPKRPACKKSAKTHRKTCRH